MATDSDVITAAAFARLADPPGKRIELVLGQVVERALSFADQGLAGGRLGALLGSYVREHHLGVMFAATGFLLTRNPEYRALARTRVHPGAPYHVRHHRPLVHSNRARSRR